MPEKRIRTVLVMSVVCSNRKMEISDHLEKNILHVVGSFFSRWRGGGFCLSENPTLTGIAAKMAPFSTYSPQFVVGTMTPLATPWLQFAQHSEASDPRNAVGWEVQEQ